MTTDLTKTTGAADDTGEDIFYFLTQNRSLGQVSERDELLHPEANAAISDESLTETQYFGFNIPEARAAGMGYLWHHPNLRLVTGGIWVFQDFRRDGQSSPILDIRSFMSDRALAGDLHDYRLDNGYGVRVVEPLARHHLTYRDDARQNHVDLRFEAIAPPVMFGEGNHFEQPLKVTGEILLRGARYAVDCFNVRDRSWGRARSERPMAVPPITWMSGVFDGAFAFNCNAYEDPATNPIWARHLTVDPSTVLKAGWVYRDGRYLMVMRASKRTEYDLDTMFPKRIELEMIDSEGREYLLEGTVLAANTWSGWPNARLLLTLTRWRCGNLVTYGEAQEPHFNDFLYHCARS